ncbi:DMT family transporter [Fusobacterium sp.]|jgi:drug/metabolite transporter (DMT)-like permease|uniref:DMT family transporter n=1 Tax=Fusobacterium sp. TaxID=68766 RepID=UPI0026276065|nr:DMT family transporter [Fusobacterium sp.]MEE1474847.1 DMT family transporter [Fusobacterium sp.]
MSNKTKAVFCMLISALGFTFMSVTVKYVTGIPLFEKVFFRNLISLGVAFFMLKKSSAPMFGRRENQLALLARSSFGLAGVVLNFYAIANLTLADSSMLGKLSPIFVTIMACIFLKEKIDSKQILSIIITFLGALLVIKPEFSLEMLPSLAGILSAAASGVAYTLLRYLKDKESPDTIIFYFSLISVVFTAPFALAEYVQPTFIQLGLLLATGVFASVGQFGITYAYKFAKATEVSIYNYSAIVFGIILGFIFFGEIPDTLSLLGGAIIIAVAFYIFKHNQKK